MRWEQEKPEWFTKQWKARIPKDYLEDVGSATNLRGDSWIERGDDETEFREAMGNAPPWSLNAHDLTQWLETNWVHGV